MTALQQSIAMRVGITQTLPYARCFFLVLGASGTSDGALTFFPRLLSSSMLFFSRSMILPSCREGALRPLWRSASLPAFFQKLCERFLIMVDKLVRLKLIGLRVDDVLRELEHFFRNLHISSCGWGNGERSRTQVP